MNIDRGNRVNQTEHDDVGTGNIIASTRGYEPRRERTKGSKGERQIAWADSRA
jgi:hypothetical protein